jgi:Recombination endonuclease VII
VDQPLFDPPPVTKRCRDCGERKPLDEFPRNKNSSDGRRTYCKPCHNARGRETLERLYGNSRHYHLKRRYGISAKEFDELVATQGGGCAICGKEEPEHVDHDHLTGEVRGVLCFNCNGGLGQFRDSTDFLRSAATYLEQRGADIREQRALAVKRAGELQRTPV